MKLELLGVADVMSRMMQVCEWWYSKQEGRPSEVDVTCGANESSAPRSTLVRRAHAPETHGRYLRQTQVQKNTVKQMSKNAIPAHAASNPISPQSQPSQPRATRPSRTPVWAGWTHTGKTGPPAAWPSCSSSSSSRPEIRQSRRTCRSGSGARCHVARQPS